MATRVWDWRSLLVRRDPDFTKDSREQVEYEFTSSGRGGTSRTHEGGKRVFRGIGSERGPYADD